MDFNKSEACCRAGGSDTHLPLVENLNDTAMDKSLVFVSVPEQAKLALHIGYHFGIFLFTIATFASLAFVFWKTLRKIAFDDWVAKYKLRQSYLSTGKGVEISRPPVVAGHFLWGSAFEFSRDTAAFLRGVAKQYGDVASIRLINRRVVVLNDVHSFQQFCHEPKFDFRPIIDQVNNNVFGFSVPNVDEHRKRLVYFYRSGKMSETVTLFDAHLNRCLDEHEQSGFNVNAYDFTIKTGFLAIFKTLVGTELGSGNVSEAPINEEEQTMAQFYSNYSAFVKHFNHLWLGLPLPIFPRAHRAFREMMSMHPAIGQIANRDDACPYMHMACKLMRGNGGSDADILRHSIELIHVHANVVRLAYWMLLHTLSDAAAKKAIVEEIDELVAQKRAVVSPTEADEALLFEIDEIEQLQGLGSVAKETLRLVSGVIVIRCVTQDTHFRTESGQTFELKRGETIFFYPPAHHHDEEIYPDPDRFIWDRFLGANFYKNGKMIDKPLLAFGNLCIGQRFALILAKWYIVQLFHRWDMELTGPVPEINKAYQGHEVLPPKSDTTFTYRPRPSSNSTVKLRIIGEHSGEE